MGRINLQSLIDEVLGMVKESQDAKKKKESELQSSWYGGNKDEENYWKDIRTRNTDIEKQRLINEGQSNVANINETGALARQRLGTESATNVANIQAGSARYTADQGLKGHEITSGATKYAADQGLKAAGLKEGATTDPVHAFITEAIKGDPTIATDPERFNQLMTNANRLNLKPPEATDIRKNFDKPDVPAPIISSATKIPTPSKGVDSMEFATDEVLKKRRLAERNKKVEEDMFGKPKRSSFFPW
jgi:hypothetical protein